jgi:hypothetical protein
MSEYTVTFAGLNVLIRYDSNVVRDFLSFLFCDVHCSFADDHEIIIVISKKDNTGQYTLTIDQEILFSGRLGVKFAAVLFDSVIFNLLNKNSNGVAIHAGAVSYREKVIILPGQSGSGKSNISAWLTAHNFSYLTDELIFLPDNKSGQAIPFTRPFCIKSGAVTEIKKLIQEDNLHDILEDEQGAVVPHRSLNPDFSIITSSPVLILFPAYQFASPLKIERISGAQACTSLMACDVNARNLADHGFQQIVRIVRSTPAYRVTYGSFKGFEDALADLFDELNRG